MTDDPSKGNNSDAEAVFDRTLKNLLTTPLKAHDAAKKGRELKPAPKRV